MGLISLLSSSCQSDAVFDQSESLATNGWVQKKHLNFPFEIQDTLKSYDLRVAIRQSNEYPFYNLYFNCRLIQDPQNIWKKAFAEACGHFFIRQECILVQECQNLFINVVYLGHGY